MRVKIDAAMATENTVQKKTRSMDEGSIKELLETEKFVEALKENLGLEPRKVKVCSMCESKLEIKTMEIPGEDQPQAVYHCGSCNRIEDQPKFRTEWSEKKNPPMSKDGVEMFISNVRGMADKNVFASNFDNGEIRSIMQVFHGKVAQELFQNWNLYGIRNKSTAHKVTAITTNTVWAGFKRSMDGQTLEAVADMGDDRTVMQRSQEDNGGGITEKLGLG